MNFKKNVINILEHNKLLYIISINFQKRIQFILNIIRQKNFNNILIILSKNKLQECVSYIYGLNTDNNFIIINFEMLDKFINNDTGKFTKLKSRNEIKIHATKQKSSNLHPTIINNFFEKPDLIVVDDSYRLGSYPKLNKYAAQLRLISNNVYIIYSNFSASIDGRLTKLFHQLYAIRKTKEKHFDEFAEKYVQIKTLITQYKLVKNYDTLNANGIKWYTSVMNDIAINIDNEQYRNNDEIISLQPSDQLKNMIYKLQNNQILLYQNETILAWDSDLKYKYLTQLVSGTIKINDNRYFIDHFKINYIYNNYRKNKVLIIAKFIAEQNEINKLFNKYKNISCIGYINNLPKDQFDYIIFYSISDNISEYQNILYTYNDVKKIYLFCESSNIEFDIYNKLKMKLNIGI